MVLLSDSCSESVLLDFSLDGRRVFLGLRNGSIRIWDTASDIETACLIANEAALNGMAVSSDGNLLLIALTDRTVRLWDVSSATQLALFYSNEDSLTEKLTFAPDAKRFACAASSKVQVKSAENGEEICHYICDNLVVDSIRFSSDGMRIAVLSHSFVTNMIRIKDRVEIVSATNGSRIEVFVGMRNIQACLDGQPDTPVLILQKDPFLGTAIIHQTWKTADILVRIPEQLLWSHASGRIFVGPSKYGKHTYLFALEGQNQSGFSSVYS
jgi:hypothetical protein